MGKRSTIVLSEHHIGQIVSAVGLDRIMDDAIAGLRSTFAGFGDGRVQIQKRTGFVYDRPEPGLVEFMTAYREYANVGLKVVGYHPGNPFRRDFPTIVATNSLYDVNDGHLIALVDGIFATAVRTGAASAVASEVLANPRSKVLGLVGCGAQAVTQAHALSRLFQFDEILVHDIRREVALSFAMRVRSLGLKTKIAERAEIESRADIICTATSVPIGGETVLSSTGFQPHVHINAVGSDIPGKVEIPLALLKECFVVPDFLEQACVEGECQQLSSEHIGPELHNIIKNPGVYEHYRDKRTIFDSTGCSLEDLLMTEILVQHAEANDLGDRLFIEAGGVDPMNPYAFEREESVDRAGQNFADQDEFLLQATG